LPLVQA